MICEPLMIALYKDVFQAGNEFYNSFVMVFSAHNLIITSYLIIPANLNLMWQ
jgi:hypothetical protein